MQHKPDIIRVAVTAAGGTQRVADHFGVRYQTVVAWWRRRRIPVHFIAPLCDLGRNVVTADSLVRYMTEAHEDATQQEREAA